VVEEHGVVKRLGDAKREKDAQTGDLEMEGRRGERGVIKRNYSASLHHNFTALRAIGQSVSGSP